MDDEEMLRPLGSTLRDVLSAASRSRVGDLLSSVESLNKMERLLLYMELPDGGKTGNADPLRQPINPLGSRMEIQLTITWIRTHLEEDPQVSLPKHEVYDEYMDYCNDNGLKALSTADFGKVMKQVYPQVRPRRLGTRGNSRYCYAGLKKRVKLEEPNTPECLNTKGDEHGRLLAPPSLSTMLSSSSSPSGRRGGVDAEDLEDAAHFLVLEWVEKLFSQKIHSIKELAIYLIEKMFVDSSSPAAQRITAAREHKSFGGDNGTGAKDCGENGDVMKRKSANQMIVVPFSDQQSSLIKEEHEFTLIKRKKIEEQMFDEDKLAQPGSFVSPELKSHLESDATTAGLKWNSMRTDISPSQQQQQQQSGAQLLPPPPPQNAYNAEQDASQAVVAGASVVLNGSNGNNGSKDDEEMNHYFNDAATGGAAASALGMDGANANGVANAGSAMLVDDADSKSDKLSQLRQLLEKNLKSSPSNSSAFRPAEPKMEVVHEMSAPSTDGNPVVGGAGGGWNEQNSSSVGVGGQTSSLCSRRRVSFNPLVVQDTGTVSNVLPSPGTRKRHFSFQPISPRQTSLPQSPNASPFISPRSTPVPMLRSRHSSGSALPLHLLPQGGGGTGTVNKLNNYNSSSSDISRAATFGSVSECSTPFISPHGTPIPFNRSRHNSAQGRLCRSRHSSGLGPYRYNAAAANFSPMALNNLNNPYSPQPSTPVAATGEDMMIGGGNGAMGMPVFPCPDSSQRSRHSSADSEHNLMMPADVVSGGGGGPLMGNGNGGGGAAGQGGNHLPGLSDPSPQSVRQRHASAGPLAQWVSPDLPISAVSGPASVGAKPDDLDLALDDLKGFDNDFSKFVDDNSDKK